MDPIKTTYNYPKPAEVITGNNLTFGLLFETKQRRGTIVISEALGDKKCLASATRAEFSPDLHSIVSLFI